MEILIYCISSAIMEIMVHGYSGQCILYVVMTTYLISCIMPIHAHCTLMYPGLLYLFVVCAKLYHCTTLIGWLVFHLGSFITPLLGWTYNVFWPLYDPSDLTHQGASIIANFTTLGESHLYGLPLFLCRLIRPLGPFFVL